MKNLLQGPSKNDIEISQESRFKYKAWFKPSAHKSNTAKSYIKVPEVPATIGADSTWTKLVKASKVRDAANTNWRNVRKSGTDLCSGDNTKFLVKDPGSQVYNNVEAHEKEHAAVWQEVFCSIVGPWSANIRYRTNPAKAVEVNALIPSVGRVRARNKLYREVGGTTSKVAGKINRQLATRNAAIDRRKGNGIKIYNIRVTRDENSRCGKVTAVIVPN